MLGKKRDFPQDKPGNDWYRAFVKCWRHEVTLCKPELLTLSRAPAYNKPVIDARFTLLGEKLTELNLNERPAQFSTAIKVV